MWISIIICCLAIGMARIRGDNSVDHINKRAKNANPKVLILGAGMAGIMAAKTLHEAGIKDFKIIEAENRIGGRMNEVKFGGATVELGCNWVHGTTGNPLYEMVKKHKLKGVITDYEDIAARDWMGNVVTKEVKEKESKLYKIYDKAERYGQRTLKKGQTDISVRTGFGMFGWIPKTEVDDIVEWLVFDFELATRPERISLQFENYHSNYRDFPDEDFFITDQRGYRYILRKEAAEFLQNDATKGPDDKNDYNEFTDPRLLLGEKVTKINYSSKGGAVVETIKMDDNSVNKYEADYVLVTFAVGVLQKEKLFDPELPQWKREPIFSFQMQTYTKIFIKFASTVKKFWDDNHFIYHAHRRRGYYPVFQNLESKGLHPAGTNVLLATTSGDESARVERMSDVEIKKEIGDVLRAMYKDKGIPDPEEIVIPRWLTNPLTHGGFPAWGLGIDKTDMEAFLAPAGPVFFAGDAVSAKYYGFLHGSILSGIQAAKDIQACANKSDGCPASSKNFSFKKFTGSK